MREIFFEDKLIARYVPADAWSQGLSFFSKDEEYVQVGTWVYDEGKKLLPHIHNNAKREISHTQEVLYVRKGSLLASVYNTNGEFIEKITVYEGDVMILLNGGHGYEILDKDTQVLEIKNGPYLGAEVDRRRI